MMITGVEPITLAIPFSYGGAARAPLDFCLVRVETDAGIVGWGEAFSYHCRSAVAAAVRDMIAPLVVGQYAGEIAQLHVAIQKKLHIFGRFGITAFALSGLDIALWDIAAKARNISLCNLLGGAKRSTVPCYASLLRYAEPKRVARHCARALEEGYGAIKLHEVSEPAVAAAREVLGAELPLMLDVNCEWALPQALEVGQALKRHRLTWLEEPLFPPEDLAGMRAVGEASGIDIASGENFSFATQFAALIQARAVRYLQPSVTKVGGITEFSKVVQLAGASGVRIAPHSPYFGPGALATLHILAALVPEARFEYYYLSAEATLYPGLFGKSEVKIPDGIGLGLEPDAAVLERYRA